MAQTFTSTACQTFGTTGFFINPPKYIEEGCIIRAATYSFALNPSATVSAVIQMVPVPRGCQVHDVLMQWDEAGGQYTVKVGDGGNVSRYMNSISVSASGVARMGWCSSAGAVNINQSGGMGYSYSVDDTIDIKIGAAGSATSVGTIRLQITYSMDNNQKG